MRIPIKALLARIARLTPPKRTWTVWNAVWPFFAGDNLDRLGVPKEVQDELAAMIAELPDTSVCPIEQRIAEIERSKHQ